MLPYQTRGYDQYGASMGRARDLSPADRATITSKLHLRRVHIDLGGYDPGGAYFGIGAPLWCVWDDEEIEQYHRAGDRDAVKALYPNAKFYR